VITGFEPVDLLEGILLAVQQLEQGRAEVENQYARAVSIEGNAAARKMVEQVFEIADRAWRGIGVIPESGYRLTEAYRDFDAERIFEVESIRTRESEICIGGQVLKGLKKPNQCPAFGSQCTPQTPLGATMVSAEGACAAYYNYGRHMVSIETST
jgi:hydrogenase expression/formation protein HypD